MNHDEHLVLKSPWTKEVETAFEKMQSQVIKMYELAFNRYNGGVGVVSKVEIG